MQIEIIGRCRAKLEEKDYLAAKLYYNLQMYQAAGIAFTNLLNSYPESTKGRYLYAYGGKIFLPVCQIKRGRQTGRKICKSNFRIF